MARTTEDARAFLETRTSDTHPLGTDPKRVLRLLKAKGRTAFVVTNGIGMIIGTATLSETEAAIGTVGISLLPTARRKGYGKQILRKVEAHARERGFIALRADVYDGNEGAKALLASEGFRRYSLFEKPI